MKLFNRLIWISLGGILLVNSHLFGQFEANSGYYAGALLFSQTSLNGSARILAIGGAQTALGGDISSVSGNPAGLGFYNRSEISITPALNFINTSSEYLGTSDQASTTNFNIANLGLVIRSNRQLDPQGIWRGGSFGFSYNRVNDFHHEIFYGGFNNTNDFIDFVLEDIDLYGYDENYYLHVLPFDTYLINDYDIDINGDTIDGVWSSFVELPEPGKEPFQSEEIKTNGSQDLWSFSYGGNVADRFYFGFSIGFVSITYKNERIYREDRYPESILDNFTLSESLKIDGLGVNGSFGAIVRPVDFITIGITYTTPTVYDITDEYEASMRSIWRQSADDFYGGDPGFTGNQVSDWNLIVSEYTLNTPMRLNTGVAVFFNKNGFITGDMEWVDYTNAALRSSDFSMDVDNANIQNLYRSCLNFRLGGEYRAGNFRYRAGYNYMADPYNDIDDLNRSRQTLSGGIGYRKKAFYSDLAVVNSFYKSRISPYPIENTEDLGMAPVASINNNILSFLLTFGFLF